MADDPVVHVIDDDDSARESLTFLLGCVGFEVESHASAIEFLKALPGRRPGCIITDIRMPEMSGEELIGRLKAEGVVDPVIVITGHADVPMAIRAMHAGVADFLEKPFSDDEILGAVRSALARREDHAQLAAEREGIRARRATLSPRERDVLVGLIQGLANKAIAYDLQISARTVEVYRAGVMTKMQARSLSELVRMVTVAELALPSS